MSFQDRNIRKLNIYWLLEKYFNHRFRREGWKKFGGWACHKRWNRYGGKRTLKQHRIRRHVPQTWDEVRWICSCSSVAGSPGKQRCSSRSAPERFWWKVRNKFCSTCSRPATERFPLFPCRSRSQQMFRNLTRKYVCGSSTLTCARCHWVRCNHWTGSGGKVDF